MNALSLFALAGILAALTIATGCQSKKITELRNNQHRLEGLIQQNTTRLAEANDHINQNSKQFHANSLRTEQIAKNTSQISGKLDHLQASQANTDTLLAEANDHINQNSKQSHANSLRT